MSSDPTPASPSPGQPPFEPLFTPRLPEKTSTPVLVWVAAGLVLLLVVGGILLGTRHKPAAAANTILPLDPDAAAVSIGQIQMSESTSLSGGKSTFIDGHVANKGSRVVTGATVQVLFANDENLPPQVETLPLALIRTHEPYVDTQPVAAAPLAPGDDREFRLIFENIGANWNQQLPQIHVVHLSQK